MTRILSFGKSSIHILYPILMSLCSVINTCLLTILNKLDEKNPNDAFGNHPFFLFWVMYLAESMILFLFLIQRNRSNRKTIQQQEQNKIALFNKPIQEETINQEKLQFLPGNKVKLLLMITFLGLFDFASSILGIILDETGVDYFYIIFQAVFLLITAQLSRIFLKYQYHRYHLAGIIIYLIGVTLYSVFDSVFIPTKGTTTLNVVLYIGLMIITQLLGAFMDCGEKYLMDEKYLSPFVIVSFEGISGFIIMSIAILISSFIQCSKDNYFCKKDQYVENLSEVFTFFYHHSLYLILYIVFFFFLFLLNVFRLLTNQHYSPAHRGISNTISPCISWVIKLCVPFMNSFSSETSIGYYIGISLSDLIMIFGVFIFLEIFILGCWKINENNREIIIKRENQEHINLLLDAKELNLGLDNM